jgi:signal transduction histidine kinase
MKLRFEGTLEERFRRDYFERALTTIRIGLLLGAALYSVFVVLDEWMLPLTKDVAFRIRFAFAVPVLLGAFVLSFTRFFERHLEALLSLTIVAGGAGIALMIAFARPSEPGYVEYSQGLSLAMLFTFSLLRMRFLPTALSSLVIITSYEVAALVVHDVGGSGDMREVATFVSNNFFLASTAVVTMLAAYTLEFYARSHFLQRLRIEEENLQVQRAMEELANREAQMVHAGRMTALGSLVAGLVHELSSPAAAIESGCETSDRILRRLSVPGSDVEAERHLTLLRECAGAVRQAAQRVSELVESLKKFSHLDQASFGFIDVHESLEATITLLAHEIGDRISVERELGSIPRLACFPADLNQLFMNVLRNAVQAIPDRGTIRLATWTERGEVRVRVADDGVGMTAEQMANLFVPTFSRTGDRVKAGLGLFISHRIAERHQGRLDVESELGRGTTVTLSLPLGLERGGRSGDPESTRPSSRIEQQEVS